MCKSRYLWCPAADSLQFVVDARPENCMLWSVEGYWRQVGWLPPRDICAAAAAVQMQGEVFKGKSYPYAMGHLSYLTPYYMLTP